MALAPNGSTNGDSLGASWGDKNVTAKGSLALAVLVVLVMAALVGFTVWWAGTEIRDAGRVIAKSNTDGFNRVLEQLERQERTSYDQHKGIEDKQRLQNCLSAYDFASRQRLRKRAEDGDLNLAAWCSWMDALTKSGVRP